MSKPAIAGQVATYIGICVMICLIWRGWIADRKQ
jgi:hypothetical protein